MGEEELAAESTEFMGYCCAKQENEGLTIAGKLVAVQFYHEQFVGQSLPIGNSLIRFLNPGIKKAHEEKGTDAESEKATDVGYADENAGGRSFLGGGGKDGIYRFGVVLLSDVVGIGIVRGGGGGISQYLFVCGGGMWRSSEIMSNWGKAGGRRRMK